MSSYIEVYVIIFIVGSGSAKVNPNLSDRPAYTVCTVDQSCTQSDKRIHVKQPTLSPAHV
jgi:hypothetical protein